MHQYSCDSSGIKAEPADSSSSTKSSFLCRKKEGKKVFYSRALSSGSKHAVRLNKIISRKNRSYNHSPFLPQGCIVAVRVCACMCVCEVYCPGHIRLTTPLTGSQSNPGATITSILALEAITFLLEIYAARWKSEVSQWRLSG